MGFFSNSIFLIFIILDNSAVIHGLTLSLMSLQLSFFIGACLSTQPSSLVHRNCYNIQVRVLI